MKQEISGKKIILREQREDDAPYFTYWFNQPEVMFQCGFEKETDLQEVKKMINVDHKSEDCIWYTITDPEGSIIGETGLLRMFPAWHQTDLSIIIPDPGNQHKGYGTEAIRIMLKMAFEECEMHRVSIGVVARNTDALEFYKRIGFRQEGILEEAYYYNNEYSDFIMMRILEQEWK
ncbi:MAG: GNAT family N-acetyltransferase [Erysipelotrichaceae bacterium]|nr:GNAT family N-acetyltransferase [Erysipelotrichaceae bacterium]